MTRRQASSISKKLKEKQKSKGKKGKKGKTRDRFYVTKEGSSSVDSQDRPVQYEGFYDDQQIWHEVYDNKSGTRGVSGRWQGDPPHVLEKYWNNITTERDEVCEEWEDEEEKEGGQGRSPGEGSIGQGKTP